MNHRNCPLCNSDAVDAVAHQNNMPYWGCDCCDLVFLDRQELLSPREERQHYLSHENTPENAGYVDFLHRAIDPLLAVLPRKARGLDFGCGPGPVGAAILEEHGFTTAVYDPFFANTQALLTEVFDFVLCTEVAEHFREPRKEFTQLRKLLREGGYLSLLTLVYGDREEFFSWWYARDPTHCVFYHPKTIQYIAEHFGFEVAQTDNERLFLLRAV